MTVFICVMFAKNSAISSMPSAAVFLVAYRFMFRLETEPPWKRKQHRFDAENLEKVNRQTKTRSKEEGKETFHGEGLWVHSIILKRNLVPSSNFICHLLKLNKRGQQRLLRPLLKKTEINTTSHDIFLLKPLLCMDLVLTTKPESQNNEKVKTLVLSDRTFCDLSKDKSNVLVFHHIKICLRNCKNPVELWYTFLSIGCSKHNISNFSLGSFIKSTAANFPVVGRSYF